MPDFGFPAQPRLSRMSTIIDRARRDSEDAEELAEEWLQKYLEERGVVSAEEANAAPR